MNNQEVYDKVKAHLLSQNRKSLDANGDCAYRGENGAMCAIGVLIPDDMYHVGLEGKSCFSEAVSTALCQVRVSFFLIRDLQDVHDNVYLSDWPTALERLAESYRLKP